MVVEVLPEVKYPHGFALSVLELEQDAPVMVQLTADSVVFLGLAVKVTCEGAAGAEMGASLTSAIPLLVSSTIIVAQPETQGPLPPLAQPLASARLNKAAANRKFFIIASLLECDGNSVVPRLT